MLIFIISTSAFVGIVALWANWITLDDDGFSPRNVPDLVEFTFLLLVNVMRVLLLKRTLSQKEMYPQYFPVYVKNKNA
jgi:hypothetical protein